MERKKSTKIIIPRLYIIPKYWDRNENEQMRIKEDEVKFLNKFSVIIKFIV